MSLARPADQDIIIIGATGDLTRRKLLPALYDLHVEELLPARGKIVGYARSKLDDDQFRERAKDGIREFSRATFDEQSWATFAERLAFVCADPGGFPELRQHCEQPMRLVYLAIPPSAFPTTVRELSDHGMVAGSRLIVEKPFGSDLKSAIELENTLCEVFEEQQIFRIDHYLGKETVQNILVFRFGNSLFERVWNRDAIDHIQITVAESIGIEGRGAFYEEVGAMRDMVQSHLSQVLSLLTMEPPSSFKPEAIRDERAKLFHAMQPLNPADVVRGQYTSGSVDGEDVPGYREEAGVDPESTTETFIALRVYIDNWRWAGVPVYLRTGKRMARRGTEVLVSFRDIPVHFFEGTGVEQLPPNHLTLTIQPNEEITFVFLHKVPGPDIQVKPVRMNFSYGEAFMGEPAAAYERLLHEAMDGDHTLFARRDGVERAWAVAQPVLEKMPPVSLYPAGSWGPPEADALIAPRRWHLR